MPNSWDAYYQRYSDWDEAHSFHVHVKFEHEDKLISLGYSEILDEDGESQFVDRVTSKRGKYKKCERDIKLQFETPYDWSIDSDWEDTTLELLGLQDEWVTDSSVEDY